MAVDDDDGWGDLFNPPPEPCPDPRARNTDPDTSHMAAASMATEAQAQRAKIFRHLVAFGPKTADALDDELDFRPTTSGRRLPELQEGGFIVMMEEKAKTRSNRLARLWRPV